MIAPGGVRNIYGGALLASTYHGWGFGSVWWWGGVVGDGGGNGGGGGDDDGGDGGGKEGQL